MHDDEPEGLPPPVPLFDWLRDDLAPRLRTREAVALLVALECSGKTGDDVLVKVKDIVDRLGLSERQVYRHVAALVRDKVLVLKTPSAPGRRARYRLTHPREEKSGVTPDATPPEEVTRDEIAPDTSSDQHLTPLPATPDTSKPENVGVFLALLTDLWVNFGRGGPGGGLRG